MAISYPPRQDKGRGIRFAAPDGTWGRRCDAGAGAIDELSPLTGKVSGLTACESISWGYVMPIHEHEPNSRGRAFLWGGVILGALFLVLALTRGFGLLGGGAKGPEEPDLMVRQGHKTLFPEGSAVRGRLSIEAAPAQAVSAKMVLPAVVESDSARTAAVLTP